MPTLNHANTFIVCRDDGGIADVWDGVFYQDTRFISRWSIRVNGQEPVALRHTRLSNRRGRWDLLIADIGNSQNGISNELQITLHRAVGIGRLHEDLEITLYGLRSQDIRLEVTVDGDFADLFEVRREDWQAREIDVTASGTTMERRYTRDDFIRRLRTEIQCKADMDYDATSVLLHFRAKPGVAWHCCIDHTLAVDDAAPDIKPSCPLQHDDDEAAVHERSWMDQITTVYAADPRLQRAVDQAVHDLGALRLYQHDGLEGASLTHSYLAAGIPWFATLFGRDSVIASLQTLVLRRDFGIGALEALGSLQAEAHDPYRDAEPGKIPHEMRFGEWATFGIVPHHPYYGSADSTALYLLLLGEIFRWTGDATRLERYRDIAVRCLEWIDQYGDRDGDGLQEYGPRALSGYPNQCWRDSPDGVPAEDGKTPLHPIATSELQAYVYGAKLAMANLFAAWGDTKRAASLQHESKDLRKRFMDHFWVAEQKNLALCLDGNKKQVTSVASDSGHCLWLGIIDGSKATAVSKRLIADTMFSGWGVRTLASDHQAYDPHSYHRGSTWPHDSIIAAAGMRRCGEIESAWRVIDGVIEATSFFSQSELPEVFSGLSRQEAPAPIPYWRANMPQAWAAGAVIHSLVILLGLAPDAANRRIYLDPCLPPWCPRLRLRGVRIGDSRLDIRASRRPDGEDEIKVNFYEGPQLEIIRGPRPE